MKIITPSEEAYHACITLLEIGDVDAVAKRFNVIDEPLRTAIKREMDAVCACVERIGQNLLDDAWTIADKKMNLGKVSKAWKSRIHDLLKASENGVTRETSEKNRQKSSEVPEVSAKSKSKKLQNTGNATLVGSLKKMARSNPILERLHDEWPRLQHEHGYDATDENVFALIFPKIGLVSAFSIMGNSQVLGISEEAFRRIIVKLQPAFDILDREPYWTSGTVAFMPKEKRGVGK